MFETTVDTAAQYPWILSGMVKVSFKDTQLGINNLTTSTRYCTRENICPRFIFTPFALVVNGKLNTGWIKMFHSFFSTQLCLGKLKIEWNQSQL